MFENKVSEILRIITIEGAYAEDFVNLLSFNNKQSCFKVCFG